MAEEDVLIKRGGSNSVTSLYPVLVPVMEERCNDFEIVTVLDFKFQMQVGGGEEK